MYIGYKKFNAREASEYYVRQIYGESRQILDSSVEPVGIGMRFQLTDGVRWYRTTHEPYGWNVEPEQADLK